MNLFISGTVQLQVLLRLVWSICPILIWCLEAPIEQGSYMDACYEDSNEFIRTADCRFPVLLVILLIAFNLNRAYGVTASNNVVLLV
jgi:hypothetical protein